MIRENMPHLRCLCLMTRVSSFRRLVLVCSSALVFVVEMLQIIVSTKHSVALYSF